MLSCCPLATGVRAQAWKLGVTTGARVHIQTSVSLALKPCLPEHLSGLHERVEGPAEHEQALPLQIPPPQHATSRLSTRGCMWEVDHGCGGSRVSPESCGPVAPWERTSWSRKAWRASGGNTTWPATVNLGPLAQGISSPPEEFLKGLQALGRPQCPPGPACSWLP